LPDLADERLHTARSPISRLTELFVGVTDEPEPALSCTIAACSGEAKFYTTSCSSIELAPIRPELRFI